MKKALIFYISKQSGHFHAANAIEKGLSSLSPRMRVEKINALTYTNPVLGKIINKAYLEIIKKRPEIWEHIYDNPDVMSRTKKARDALHRFNMSKIKRLLEKRSPDVIICTQAFPCGMVADYKRTTGYSVPLMGVLTDHAPHSYWLFKEVDYYVAPSDETAAALEKKGIPREKIKTCGIPVDPKFKKGHDVPRLRKELGLTKGDPVILIMGGSQGLGAVEEAVRSIMEDQRHSYQILVVTGSNNKLYKRLGRLRKALSNSALHVVSFVDNIDELMEASDMIVTKAGGMTTAEAMVKDLPLVIIDPIPGHERMNTDFLVGKGAAVEVSEYRQLPLKINEIFDSRGTLEKMKDNIRKLAKPDSAVEIAELALGV